MSERTGSRSLTTLLGSKAIQAALVVVLAAVVLLPGLGRTGLWDPWEMGSAHVARTMAGPPQVLVVAPPSSRKVTESDDAEPHVTERVAQSAPEAEIRGPRSYLRSSDLRRKKVPSVRVLAGAEGVLQGAVVHGIVLSAELIAADPNDADDVGKLAKRLDDWRLSNGGTPVGLVLPAEHTDAAVWQTALLEAQVRRIHGRIAGALKDTEKDAGKAAAKKKAKASAQAKAKAKTDGKEAVADDGAPAAPVALSDEAVSSAAAALADDAGFSLPNVVFIAGPSDADGWATWASKIPSPLARSQFKRDGVARVLPPLEPLATAFSFRWFGFSETSARLPGALLGIFGALVLFLGLRRSVGPMAAGLAAVVLVTTPLYFAQARFVGGGAAFTVFLAMAAVAYLRLVEDGLRPSWATLFVAATLGLLFAKGLYGVLVLGSVVGLYLLVTADRSRAAWAAAGLVAGVLALGTLASLGSEDWSWFHHLRYSARLFSDGLLPESRTFDFILKHLGFGLIPWSPLLIFGVGALVLRLARPRVRAMETQRVEAGEPSHRATALIVAWALAPLALTMLSAEPLSQYAYAGVAGVAAAIGVFLAGLSRTPRRDAVAAFAIVLMALVLYRESKSYADSLFSFVTTDPPFVRDGDSALRFPADYEPSRGFRIFILLVALAMANYWAQLSTWAARGIALVKRPYILASALAFLYGALLFRWVFAGEALFSGNRAVIASLKLPRALAAFGAQAINRPEQGALALLAGVLIIAAFLRGTPWGRSLASASSRRLPAWIRRIGRIPSAWLSAVAGLCGVGLLITGVVLAQRPPDFGVGTTLLDPVVWILVLATLFTVAWRALPAWGATAWARARLEAARPAWAPVVLMVGVTLGYLGLRWTKELWQIVPGHLPLALVLALAGGVVLARSLRRPLNALLIAAGVWTLYAAGALYPMLAKWVDIADRLYPNGDGPTWVGTFVYSRVVLGSVAGAVALGVLVGWDWFAARHQRRSGGVGSSRTLVGRLMYAVGNTTGWLENGRVLASAAVLAGLGATLMYQHDLVASMSYHVSQKHILDTFEEARGDTEGPGWLFAHGAFGGSGGDSNFYTNSVPRIADRKEALRGLARRANTLVAAQAPSGAAAMSPLLRADGSATIIPGWSDDNDPDGDGRRDWKADAGIAESVDGTRLVDPTKNWEPNEWVGSVLIDSGRRSHPVKANGADWIETESRPAFSPGREATRRYVLDHPDAPDHQATAMQRERSFAILPVNELSELNYRYRKLADGSPLPILDDRSARLALAASWLEEGEENHNEFAKHTLTQEQFDALEPVNRTSVMFDDKLEIVGYGLERNRVKRRSDYELKLYFKVHKPLKKNWKIFLHVDADKSTHRVHSDHYVLNRAGEDDDEKCVGCYRANHWMPGDIIVDPFSREIPLATPSGRQGLWIGMYDEAGDGKRMKITDFDKKKVEHDGTNRVRIGSFSVY